MYALSVKVKWKPCFVYYVAECGCTNTVSFGGQYSHGLRKLIRNITELFFANKTVAGSISTLCNPPYT